VSRFKVARLSWIAGCTASAEPPQCLTKRADSFLEAVLGSVVDVELRELAIEGRPANLKATGDLSHMAAIMAEG
jgi:hypothetical protein